MFILYTNHYGKSTKLEIIWLNYVVTHTNVYESIKVIIFTLENGLNKGEKERETDL